MKMQRPHADMSIVLFGAVERNTRKRSTHSRYANDATNFGRIDKVDGGQQKTTTKIIIRKCSNRQEMKTNNTAEK